jgi:hypothetical protein
MKPLLYQSAHVEGFYVHLAQFVVVINVLAVVNILINRHYLWFQRVAFGCGSGVLAHGLKASTKFLS